MGKIAILLRADCGRILDSHRPTSVGSNEAGQSENRDPETFFGGAGSAAIHRRLDPREGDEKPGAENLQARAAPAD